MFRMIDATEAATDFHRRRFLQAGFLGLGGLTLGQMHRLEAAGAATKSDTAVILLFVHGGPSHLETYDMKPHAAAEIRGPFTPIRTNIPGIDVCEHSPKHAKLVRNHPDPVVQSR